MKTPPPLEKLAFQKTKVPCLYRYSSNGVYYALVKHEGKQKPASLEITDKGVAKRKRADFQRDLGEGDSSSGRATLREAPRAEQGVVGSGATTCLAQRTPNRPVILVTTVAPTGAKRPHTFLCSLKLRRASSSRAR